MCLTDIKKLRNIQEKAVREMGLSLYLESGYADTVTVINVPDGYTDTYIFRQAQK